MKQKLKYVILTGAILISVKFSFAQSIAGDSLFNTLQVHSIYINFSQSGYWNQLVNNKAYDDANDSSTYIPASVIIDGKQVDSVGIQFKGNSSYYNYPSNKKPFTLSFNEYILGQKYNGLKSVNLNNFYQDPAFMREKLMLDFMNKKNIYSPRANYARLYLNGTYWGLYLMVERVNKTFLKDRFGDNNYNLFKGDNSSGVCADLKYHGTINAYYNCYELKTNEIVNNWSDLINLTAQINNTTNAQFRDSVEAVMNTNSFIGAWAAYNLFVDFDSYPYRFIHNYYIYHDSLTKKFQWIVWDVSTAFGMDVPGTIPQIEATSVLYVNPLATDRPLVNRMLNDSTYKDTYLKLICSFANNDFLSSVLDPKIDSIYNLIKTDVYADPMKMYTNLNFDDNVSVDINVSGYNIPGLKSFINIRNTNVLNELNTLGYTNCPATAVAVNENKKENTSKLYISPNPSNNLVTVEFDLQRAQYIHLSILNMDGSLAWNSGKTYCIQGKNKINIQSQDIALKAGMYYIKLLSGSQQVVQKLILIK